MAIRTVVTRGFGNGTFSGTIALAVTRGYAIAAAAVLSGPGLEWTLPDNRLHYDLQGRAAYTLPINRIHYDLKE